MTRAGATAIGIVLALAACAVATLPDGHNSNRASVKSNAAGDGALASAKTPRHAAPARGVGRIDTTASGHCRLQECPLGSLVADAVLWRLRDRNVRAALLPSGAIKGFLREGDVTTADIEAAIDAVAIDVKGVPGSELRDAIEAALASANSDPRAFPQVSGLRYVWSPSHPPGRRLMSVEIADDQGRYRPIVSSERYGVAFGTGARSASPELADAARSLTAYLENQSPLRVPPAGRIVQR